MLIKQNQLVINGTTLEQSDLQAIANVASDVQAQIDTKASINNAQFTGNVGIGTSSPATQASVQNSSTSLGLEIDTTSGFASGPTLRGYYRSSNSYKPIAMTGSTVHFGINDVEKMRIDSSGNVGIGQSNPDARLDLGTLNSSTAGSNQMFQLGAFGFRHEDTGGFNHLYLERNYGGWQTTPQMTFKANGNVGIGTTNPDFKFNVVGSTNYETVKLYYTETANVTQRLGIAGRNYENTDNIGMIAMYDDGNNCVINIGGGFTAPDNIEFRTGSTSSTRMNIDPSGNLVVGNASTSFTSDRLQVKSPAGEPVASFYRPRNTAGGGLVRFMSDVGGTQTIVAQVTSEGNFITNGGINFGGSVNSGGVTSSSNTLDDYEEGTWTPVTSSGTMNGGSGSYVKIGSFVALIFRWSSISGGSGQVNIAGLPFTRSTSLNNLSPASGNCMFDGINTTRGITPYLGSNTMTFYGNGSGNSNTWWYLQHSDANGGTQPLEVYGSIWYYTDQ
jgi:hypothetical protein